MKESVLIRSPGHFRQKDRQICNDDALSDDEQNLISPSLPGSTAANKTKKRETRINTPGTSCHIYKYSITIFTLEKMPSSAEQPHKTSRTRPSCKLLYKSWTNSNIISIRHTCEDTMSLNCQ